MASRSRICSGKSIWESSFDPLLKGPKAYQPVIINWDFADEGLLLNGESLRVLPQIYSAILSATFQKVNKLQPFVKNL